MSLTDFTRSKKPSREEIDRDVDRALHGFLYCLALRFWLWLRWKFWRGKVCPMGGRCKTINCNIAEGNCYRKYSAENDPEQEY